MHTFPMHLQLSFTSDEWSQLQTLMQLSSEDLRAAKASPTVEETTERDFKGGLPRQRSATSYANNRTAIQYLSTSTVVQCSVWMGWKIESKLAGVREEKRIVSEVVVLIVKSVAGCDYIQGRTIYSPLYSLTFYFIFLVSLYITSI